MSSVVCTLFEHDYHYGVGALVNSLCRRGFAGVVYAGYRGPLPPWAVGARREGRYTALAVTPEVTLRFVPVATAAHFSNYKPDFMLTLWNEYCPEAGAMFYFDPDILVQCRWSFFEEWVRCGVAVCADLNPLFPDDHPLRHAWRQYYEPHGIRFARPQSVAYNGGFVGVSAANRGFLALWQRLQKLMEPAIGDMGNVDIGDRTFLFHYTDQDAFNVATMACDEPVSSVGLEGMDFEHGGGFSYMTHAAGGFLKPWQKKFVWSTLRGHPRRRTDKVFWQHVSGPIRMYSPLRVFIKRVDVMAGSFLGRYVHV